MFPIQSVLITLMPDTAEVFIDDYNYAEAVIVINKDSLETGFNINTNGDSIVLYTQIMDSYMVVSFVYDENSIFNNFIK